MPWSYSRINQAQLCAYALHRQLTKAPKTANPHAHTLLGSLAHDLLSCAIQKKPLGVDLTKAIPDGIAPDEFFKAVAKLIKGVNTWLQQRQGKTTTLFSEERIHIRTSMTGAQYRVKYYSAAQITGVLDVVEVLNPLRIRVLDFKSYDDDPSPLQLKIYTLLVFWAWPFCEEVSLDNYILSTCAEKHYTSYCRGSIPTLKAQVLEEIQKAQSNYNKNWNTPTANKWCKYCLYRGDCSVWGQLKQEMTS